MNENWEFIDDGQTPLKINDPRELGLRKHELFVKSLVSKPNTGKARKWLSHSASRRHLLGDFDAEDQVSAFVDRLYKAGAEAVICADLYKNAAGDEFCDNL